MSVKVILIRRAPPGQDAALRDLIGELRSAALGQPGYIGGETLVNLRNACEVVVISSWDQRGDWEAWYNSEARAEVQSKIDKLVGSPTYHEVYAHGG